MSSATYLTTLRQAGLDTAMASPPYTQEKQVSKQNYHSQQTLFDNNTIKHANARICNKPYIKNCMRGSDLISRKETLLGSCLIFCSGNQTESGDSSFCYKKSRSSKQESGHPKITFDTGEEPGNCPLVSYSRGGGETQGRPRPRPRSSRRRPRPRSVPI